MGFAPQESQEWTAEEIRNTDSARDYPGLTEDEKDLFLYLNLARVYPKKYVRLYLNKEAMKYLTATEKRYSRSLIRDLNALGSIPPVQPNAELMEMAECFSKEKSEKWQNGSPTQAMRRRLFWRMPFVHILQCCAAPHSEFTGGRRHSFAGPPQDHVEPLF